MRKTEPSSSPPSKPSTSSSPSEKPDSKPRIDPSFKSKRYRDKLRTEVKALEALLPVDRTSLSRKLDSQTVFRLVIALLRTKGYFNAAGQSQEESVEPVPNGHSQDSSHQDTDHDDVTQLVRGLGCLQVLDGFLLLLTADGTILYVSDNVLQYLGYNQVDLMHRCLYSVVHQDDMVDLKVVLETSLGNLVMRYDTQNDSHQAEEYSLGTNEMCKPLSFICRMRCFSGSSVGYLKMHCSGKIVQCASLPKSKRASGSVVLLFCIPFMLRAAEFTTDLQKNVFWSKHDLDLNIKEIDQKGADIIGFQTEELEKRSFYTLVHPEDLTALSTCHKMLVESSEVQTVHFRLQTKEGDWVWLTSRGKVISKNSKKFSIAFSHCPLREDDSTYIQQEAILRRRYAISDLMYLSQFKRSSPLSFAQNASSKEDKHHQASKSKKDQRYQPYSLSHSEPRDGKADSKKEKEEVGLLDTSCILEVACPSAWHALSDRHSPVLPSSHVAHKISQREKQLQFQEFCRRQQAEGMNVQSQQPKFSSTWDELHPYSTVSHHENPNSSCAVSAGQNLLATAASSGLPVRESAHSGACSYAGDSYPGSFGPCVEYNAFAPAQLNGAMGYAHHWYRGAGPGDATVNQSAGTCLTPTRSPHQCSVLPTSAQAGGSAAQCSFPPPPPPAAYGTVHITQSVSVAYPSMPPSPPPSPPPAPHPSALCHRPAPYQHSLDVVDENSGQRRAHHQQYRPADWYSPYQTYGFIHPAQQPNCYAGSNGFVSASDAARLNPSSISDIEKTSQKCLPVKLESRCENGNSLLPPSSASQHQTQDPLSLRYNESTNQSRSNRWESNPQWSPTCSSGPAFKPSVMPLSQLGHVDAGARFSSADNPSPRSPLIATATCLPKGYQDVQRIAKHSLIHSASSSTTIQYMSYPYPSTPSTLGPPPAYPYSLYPQLGHHSGQYPVNAFYATQNDQMKGGAEFPMPAPERSIDLPSIGSFLEYLNEV